MFPEFSFSCTDNNLPSVCLCSQMGASGLDVREDKLKTIQDYLPFGFYSFAF